MASWVTTPRKKVAGAKLRSFKGYQYTLTVRKNQAIGLIADDADAAYRKACDIVRGMMPSLTIRHQAYCTKTIITNDGIVLATLSGRGVSDGKAERKERAERAARTAARIAKYGA